MMQLAAVLAQGPHQSSAASVADSSICRARLVRQAQGRSLCTTSLQLGQRMSCRTCCRIKTPQVMVVMHPGGHAGVTSRLSAALLREASTCSVLVMVASAAFCLCTYAFAASW